jgi:hypothetical protein
MQRFNVSVSGQDVTLSIDSRLYDPKNPRILGPYDYFAPGSESRREVILCYGKRRRSFTEDDSLQLTHYRGKAGSHIIRQLVCFLAAYHSRDFDLVHGTGLLVDPRKNLGVLLVGAAHSGKSTLSAKLGDILIDDDLMLVTRDTMRVAGKMGFVSYRHPENGRKYLTPLPNGVKEAHLDLVFILDKKQSGGTVMEVDNTIPRRYAAPNDLPRLLKQAYLRMPPIKVDARIYRLGTRGQLQQTLRIARHIISQHI